MQLVLHQWGLNHACVDDSLVGREKALLHQWGLNHAGVDDSLVGRGKAAVLHDGYRHYSLHKVNTRWPWALHTCGGTKQHPSLLHHVSSINNIQVKLPYSSWNVLVNQIIKPPKQHIDSNSFPYLWNAMKCCQWQDCCVWLWALSAAEAWTPRDLMAVTSGGSRQSDRWCWNSCLFNNRVINA